MTRLIRTSNAVGPRVDRIDGGMDVLSHVLGAIRLEGAFFYNAEFSSPWRLRSPASRELVPHLAPRAEHLIVHHFVTEGRSVARLDDGERMPLEAGDVVVFPHGDAHHLENGAPRKTWDNRDELAETLAGGLRPRRLGGGGAPTKFVCGYLACESSLARVLLAGLPSMWKVNVRAHDHARWLETTLDFAVAEAAGSRPGSTAVLAKLSEVLFVETLRIYVASLPPNRTGWLAGARDPHVGRALALLHREPTRDWTIAELARDVGVSRSVLSERFRHYLGEPPIAYLARWRLQLGAELLTTTSHGVARIAGEVGYESEPAFNRAFKRAFGAPPARFRAQARSRRTGRGGQTGTA